MTPQQQQQQQQQQLASLLKQDHDVIELSVPENLVGAILGRSGRTLLEYQQISGAKIQISKKGDHLPGTRNRRVSIQGRHQAVQTAQFLITQRVTSTQNARAQQQIKLM